MRTSDGTQNDVTCPGWAVPACGSGACALERAFPDAANLLDAQPAAGQPRAPDARHLQPATFLDIIAAAWIEFMVHVPVRP